MWIIFIRTLIVYGALIVIMRFMGKRQLGELEIADLVTTLLISEVASQPLTDPNSPLSHALLPILVLMSLEVLLSGGLLKFTFLKRILSVRPAILIRKGVPDRRAMHSVRISSEELLSQLRQKEVTDPREVEYAILEPNGQISVIKREDNQPTLTKKNTAPQKGGTSVTGMMHLVISDGVVNPRNLALAGKDEPWLEDYLKSHNLHPTEVFMLLVDDGGQVRVFRKEEGKP